MSNGGIDDLIRMRIGVVKDIWRRLFYEYLAPFLVGPRSKSLQTFKLTHIPSDVLHLTLSLIPNPVLRGNLTEIYMSRGGSMCPWVIF